MTITYLLMLLFVFWTLWLLSSFFNRGSRTTSSAREIGAALGRAVWAALGTLFFHNVW